MITVLVTWGVHRLGFRRSGPGADASRAPRRRPGDRRSDHPGSLYHVRALEPGHVHGWGGPTAFSHGTRRPPANRAAQRGRISGRYGSERTQHPELSQKLRRRPPTLADATDAEIQHFQRWPTPEIGLQSRRATELRHTRMGRTYVSFISKHTYIAETISLPLLLLKTTPYPPPRSACSARSQARVRRR